MFLFNIQDLKKLYFKNNIVSDQGTHFIAKEVWQ